MRRPLMRAQQGFSLIEMVVVLAVIAILAVQAGGYLANLATARRLQTAADTLQAAAQRARGEAIKRNQTVQLRSSGLVLEVALREGGNDVEVLSTVALPAIAPVEVFTLDFDSAGRLTPFGTEKSVAIAKGAPICSAELPCPVVYFTPVGGVKTCRSGACS